jgi:glycine cleavage system transcriptional repressor
VTTSAASAPASRASCVCRIVFAVFGSPVPASTTMRPATWATAARSSRTNSSSDSAAASPVEPATTTPCVPPASCRSSRRVQASRSASPAAVKGVASAVMLPWRCKGKGLQGLAAMLLAGGKRRQVCWPRPFRAVFPAPPRIPALTDSTARPPANENHLLINAYTTHPQSPLLSVTRRISDSGCNLVDARLSTVGRDVSVTALALGSWDAVAKLEAMLTRLEREEGLKLVWYRTGPKPSQSNLLPYVVEVVAADKPGILFQLADFFDRQGITIESLHSSRYRAMQTGADMFSAQVTIGIPANMHIAALRDDFLEFCDHLNLDAIMDPMKF